MNTNSLDPELEPLAERIGSSHLRRRLGLEEESDLPARRHRNHLGCALPQTPSRWHLAPSRYDWLYFGGVRFLGCSSAPQLPRQ